MKEIKSIAENQRIAEELKHLFDYKPNKEIKNLLALSVESIFENIEKQRKDIVIALFLNQAVVENITLRQVCERYYIEETPVMDDKTDIEYYRDLNGRVMLKRFDMKKEAERIDYECRLRLVKRPQPSVLDDTAFEEFKMDVINYLCKNLKV